MVQINKKRAYAKKAWLLESSHEIWVYTTFEHTCEKNVVAKVVYCYSVPNIVNPKMSKL